LKSIAASILGLFVGLMPAPGIGQTLPRITDPIFGLSYDSAKVRFEEAADVVTRCPELANERWGRRVFLFARSVESSGTYVVLGGLYGMWNKDEWDWGVDDTAVKRYTLRTPGGQRVRLDDAKQVVRLENSDGSYFEMTPDKVTVHSQRDLQIEAPGRNLVIKANKVDFQQG